MGLPRKNEIIDFWGIYERIREMSVSDLELKCYEYLFAIKDIEKLSGMGIYGLDAQREKIHDEIIKLSGLSRDEMCDITDNMKGGINGTELYFLLKDRKKELRK